MKLRTLLLVVTILAALSAAVFFTQRSPRPKSADIRLGEPLTTIAQIEEAVNLRVTDQNKTVTLARQPDGSWSVTSFFDLPADFAKITGLVGSLTEAKIQRLVTTRAERMDHLGFKDTQVVLINTSGKEFLSLSLGKNAEGGGRFVRYGVEPKAYLANFEGSLDAESKNWANPILLNLKPEDIAQADISTGQGSSILISRTKKDEAWTSAQIPGGKKINANKISALLASLGNLRFTETSELNDPGYIATKASARVCKLTTFEGKTLTLTFSHKPEEKISPTAAIADVTTSPSKPSPALNAPKQIVFPPSDAGPIPLPQPANTTTPGFAKAPVNPVFVVITHSDASAPVNAIMQKRAFQIAGYILADLPQKADELFESIPPPEPAKSADEKIDEPKRD